MRKFLSSRGMIPVVLCFQVVPLLVFPLSSYSVKSQEWWLPVLLTFLVVIALIQLFVRKTQASWPWYLVSFAQGVNIISRIMMLLPHTTVNHEGNQEFNTEYFIVAVAAMLISAFEIWYNELPEVRRKLLSA
jgi:zinc transporter ZupT